MAVITYHCANPSETMLLKGASVVYSQHLGKYFQSTYRRCILLHDLLSIYRQISNKRHTLVGNKIVDTQM